MNSKATNNWQVINWDPYALTCHTQVIHKGFFKTEQQAQDFAKTLDPCGGKIFVRKTSK